MLLTAIIAMMLMGCGSSLPHPEVKDGKFDVSVTYELNGEIKTLDLVYVCEYDGVKRTMEWTSYRAWNGHFEGYEPGEVIDIFNAEDGSRIVFCFLIYAEYFMGEPDYLDDFNPQVKVERIYFEDGVEWSDSDQELISKDYGIRIIDIDYDDPIKNTFK